MSSFLPSFGGLRPGSLVQRATPDPERQKRLDKALRDAIEGKNSAAVKVLLAAGADVNALDVDGEEGETPIQLARKEQRFDIAVFEELLAAGADPNSRAFYWSHYAGGDDGMRMLLYAADDGNVDMARALLEAGADANARYNGQTALIVATKKGQLEMIQVLLAAGANVNARDKDGETALSQINIRGRASWYEKIAIEEVLGAAGATE